LHFYKNFDSVIIVGLSIEVSRNPTSDPRNPDMGREMSLGTTAVENDRADILSLP